MQGCAASRPGRWQLTQGVGSGRATWLASAESRHQTPCHAMVTTHYQHTHGRIPICTCWHGPCQHPRSPARYRCRWCGLVPWAARAGTQGGSRCRRGSSRRSRGCSRGLNVCVGGGAGGQRLLCRHAVRLKKGMEKQGGLWSARECMFVLVRELQGDVCLRWGCRGRGVDDRPPAAAAPGSCWHPCGGGRRSPVIMAFHRLLLASSATTNTEEEALRGARRHAVWVGVAAQSGGAMNLGGWEVRRRHGLVSGSWQSVAGGVNGAERRGRHGKGRPESSRWHGRGCAARCATPDDRQGHTLEVRRQGCGPRQPLAGPRLCRRETEASESWGPAAGRLPPAQC
jgi:hypothetical protein